MINVLFKATGSPDDAGRLLKMATEDVSSQDLHDCALLYYRLIKANSVNGNPAIARDVVSTD